MTNNKDKTPKKYTIDNYDYSKICNQPGCEEESVICVKCLERTGKEIIGHKHEHLKLRNTKNGSVFEETKDDIKVSIKVTHAHFALRKGTQVPELDTGRNLRCIVGERWANKIMETYVTRKLKGSKGVPSYLKDE